ncbi:hypothetical protein FIBSPDRAFT_795210, partial [Athelia psychrophila]
MLAAAEKRRKNPANYQCPQCHASFTAENSRARHIASHLGEKPFTCSKLGCGQLFSNDDDRKRHEMKSKKHAAMHTPESTSPRPGIEHGLSIPGISTEPHTGSHVQEMQWNPGPYQEASPFMQGYPSGSAHQEIPRINIQPHNEDLCDSIPLRARSGLQRIQRRAGTPYEQPEDILGTVPLGIPAYSMADGLMTPDHTEGWSSSSSSLNERGVATPAMLTTRRATRPMLDASGARRRIPAKYHCPHCHDSFTAAHSLTRHIAGHLGIKRFECSKLGCGKRFMNDSDRKRHEKSKKHAPESTLPRPEIEHSLFIPGISVEPPTDPHTEEMQWNQ